MKIAIIGCTHAGTITANQVLTNHPDAEVIIFHFYHVGLLLILAVSQRILMICSTQVQKH